MNLMIRKNFYDTGFNFLWHLRCVAITSSEEYMAAGKTVLKFICMDCTQIEYSLERAFK